jgi:prepilin-type N-terminal cleavage/methylation domain-containing protein
MRRRGFTLLELLLAMALVVVIAGVMATALFTAFKAKARAEATIGATREQDTALATLAQDVATALPSDTSTASTAATGTTGSTDTSGTASTPLALIGGLTDGSAWVATATDLTFYCPETETQDGALGGVRMVEYSFEQVTGETGQSLVRRVSNNLLAPQPVTPDPEVLVRNVLSLAFRYYDGTTWYDVWDNADHTNALPVAVELTMELAPREPGLPSVQVDRVLPVPCGVAQTVLDAAASSTGGG